MESTFRVAVVQASPVVFDRERTIDKVDALAGDAARQGARLVLFPEAFVSAYPRGLDFGAVVGSRTDEGREDFRRYWDSSVDVPGPAVDRLARTARAHDIYLVIGVVEREGGTLYCTVLFFAPDGAYLGKHRKIMPTGVRTSRLGLRRRIDAAGVRHAARQIGAVICWENYLPLMRAAMYAKGIELYCAPTADGRDSWIASMRHIAVEGRCFVLSCNQFNRRRDFPPTTRHPTATTRTRSFRAAAAASSTRSEIFSPDRISRAKQFSSPRSIALRSSAANTISTSSATTRGRTSFSCTSTNGRSKRLAFRNKATRARQEGRRQKGGKPRQKSRRKKGPKSVAIMPECSREATHLPIAVR